MPLISVVIPVRNGEPYIAHTIMSVLDQKLEHHTLELLVHDNNSMDQTVKVVETFEDDRIRIIRSNVSLSAAENWTEGTKACRGEFIKVLPADDLLEPGSLEALANILAAESGAVLAAGFRRFISDSGKQVISRFGLGSLRGLNSKQSVVREIRARGTNIIGEPGNVMFRANALMDSLPWDETHPYVIDLDMYLKVLSRGDFFALNQITSSFRATKSSWSNTLRSTQLSDFLYLMNRGTEQSEIRSNCAIKVFAPALLSFLGRSLANKLAKILDRFGTSRETTK